MEYRETRRDVLKRLAGLQLADSTWYGIDCSLEASTARWRRFAPARMASVSWRIKNTNKNLGGGARMQQIRWNKREGSRSMQYTANDELCRRLWRIPANDFSSLGARKRGEREGNERGSAGLFIEARRESFNGVLRRQSRGGFLPWFGRGNFAWRKKMPTSRMTSRGTHLSLRQKKKKGTGRAGCVAGLLLGCWLARGLLGWPN